MNTVMEITTTKLNQQVTLQHIVFTAQLNTMLEIRFNINLLVCQSNCVIFTSQLINKTMKASELISQLQELIDKNGDKELVLRVTDHTDWDYHFEFPDFELDEVYDEDDDFEGEYFVCHQSI